MSSITKYEGRTFTHESFVIEECCFVNCVLRECDLFYSGGDYDLTSTPIENCQWHFRGKAAKTLQLAGMLGLLKTSRIVKPLSSVN
jgi:hypothetical protein